ncbi:MAG: hypothetical protein DSM107014_00090 [Gomphosphaeria aponina SAG 52.96 = DSM 107014]|uniref:Uncharacterized protein n=1 Tax=Gomphosphaeria aponina SAG 52.96 = DSM 107014 TaxID=1521640 RepID=A0A941GLH1_9CHRO|nr:hypothetical protein [Gomphosphaeria aponina SAG 52.96 = DSM 107014]
MKQPLDAIPSTPPSSKVPEIEEIVISVSAKNLNPSMLNLDFLKMTGIVPGDWQIMEEPVVSSRISRISFQNGVSIVAQPGSISFREMVNIKTKQELNAPDVASQYVEKLPHAEYQVLNISPRILLPVLTSQDGARKYITENLLAPGPWLNIGKIPVQAGINLFYELEGCQLNLVINEAHLQQRDPNKPAISALLFSGSFSYNVANENEQTRLNQLTQRIKNWKNDVVIFRNIVHEKFAAQLPQEQDSLFLL